MGIKVGSFSATTQPIGGMPDTPYFVIFTGTNRTEYDSIVTTGARGGFLGFACNEVFGFPFPIKNYSEFVMMAGGACSVLSENAIFAQNAAGSYNNAALHLYRGSVTAWNLDGFDVTFDVSDPSSTIYYMAFYGIDGSASFLYEPNCDGDTSVSIGVPPSVVLGLSNWRNNCHTLPKITSSERWYTAGIADLAGGSGILGAEWMYHCWSGGDSRLTQRYDNSVNQPGTNAVVAAICDPFVFGTTIPLGFLELTRSGNDIDIDQPGQGGAGFAFAALHELCTRMECAPISAQPSVGSQIIENLTEIISAEAVIFFNDMEHTPIIQSNSDGRWGFGFASPDFEYGWACDNNGGGPFFQTEQASWISSISATDVSMGTTQFFSSGVGFTTTDNGDGPGVCGMGAFRTYCDAPPLVSFSGFLTTRPSGSQITTRGGPVLPGSLPTTLP